MYAPCLGLNEFTQLNDLRGNSITRRIIIIGNEEDLDACVTETFTAKIPSSYHLRNEYQD